MIASSQLLAQANASFKYVGCSWVRVNISRLLGFTARAFDIRPQLAEDVVREERVAQLDRELADAKETAVKANPKAKVKGLLASGRRA